MTFKYTIWIVLITFSTLLACSAEKTEKTENDTTKIQQEFEVWSAKNKKMLDEYQHYLEKNLKNPPELFYLTTNQHIQPECAEYRFSLPPKSQWKNIIQPFKLIESLQAQGIIEQYKVTSTYRGQEANICSKGAKKSKHLQNYAVDFMILDSQGQPFKEVNLVTQQKLCQFWKKLGKKQNMGLGTYHNNQYHFDTSGYRTWGSTYKTASSSCLKTNEIS